MTDPKASRARSPFGDYETPRFRLGQIVAFKGRRANVIAFNAWELPIVLIGLRFLDDGSEELVSAVDLKRPKYGGRKKSVALGALEGHSNVAAMSKDFCVKCQDITLHRYRICIHCGDSHAVSALSYRAKRRWGGS